MSRLSCIQSCLCPDYRAFKDTFYSDYRAFIVVSRPCNFERTTRRLCVYLCQDISTFCLAPQPGQTLKIFAQVCPRFLRCVFSVAASCQTIKPYANPHFLKYPLPCSNLLPFMILLRLHRQLNLFGSVINRS